MSDSIGRADTECFPSARPTGRGSKQIADSLLADAGVACLNGAGFGEYGEGYVRFSYANSYENLMRAIERIKAWGVRNS